MAKRRLNKKVALIGSTVFAILVLVLILLILRITRDPEKYIRDGDAAIKAAIESTDLQTKLQEYKRAERNYHKAHTQTKDDSLKIKVLFKLVDLFIQKDKYTEDDQWRYALGCWYQIVMTDSSNIKARYGRLKYFYIMTDSGVHRIWKEVRDQASEFIEVATNANLLMSNTDKLKTSGMPEIKVCEQPLGLYLYLIRGRANLELARRGAVTNPDELITQSINDMEKVLEFDQKNTDAYWFLAQATIQKGENLAKRGNLEEREKAIEKATEILEQSVKVAPSNPEAYINLLTLKTAFATITEIEEIESEYLALIEKFPSNARIFALMSRFYSGPRLGPKNIEKATETAEKAIILDKEDVTYAINAANLYYCKFSYYGQNTDLQKAIKIAKNALNLPNARERSGPRNWANRINRGALYSFLANCYIEQILGPREERTESETAVLLANAEQAVHEIEQIFGSGEDPRIIKWRGMLELAKGNKDVAIRKLYAAHEHLMVSEKPDPQLAYTLAKVFKNTLEIGAVADFLVSALKANIVMTKPEARMDYMDVLLELKAWTAAISNINAYEETYGPNKRLFKLRIKAYIGAKQFDEAEEELEQLKPNDPDGIKLKLSLALGRIEQIQRAILQKKIQENQGLIFSPDNPYETETIVPEKSEQLMTDELNNYIQLASELVGQLLQIEPNTVEQNTVTRICRNYIIQGQISEAKDLINKYLQYFPDNTEIMVYKQILSEPEPGNVPQQRLYEIEEQVLSNIDDPIQRAMRLGLFYMRINQKDKAATELNKVLKLQPPQEVGRDTSPFETPKEKNLRPFAADNLLDIVLGNKDFEQAEQIVEIARNENLDGCQGLVFAARLDTDRGNFKDALTKLNESLKLKPIFSRAYLLRSNIYAALGDDHSCMKDIRKAASLNPLDKTIVKGLAIALYKRDLKLGVNVSSEQTLETRTALDIALSLNTNDFQLLNFYADYVSQVEPLRALAIRQNIQKISPSVRNATRLGQLATSLAVEETRIDRKEALFQIAASSFEQAKQINPQDPKMLHSYANYYTAIGQDDKAQKLLKDSEDQGMLWNHYIQQGNYERAKNILEQMYKSNTNNIDVIKGLLLIASRTMDKEAVQKYSEELLLLQDNIDNHLSQIQIFLQVGLIKEAEHKLQSLKENYPDESRVMLLEAWLAMRQGQLERALELSNRCLESNQDIPVIWRLRGEINLFMANYDEAISDLNRSKQLSDKPDTRLSLAKAYLKMGRKNDAVIELKNIIDMPDAPMEGRVLLEQTYRRLNRKNALRNLYNETLEKFPNDTSWCNRSGAFFISEGNIDMAEKLYQRAYQLKCQEYSEANATNKEPDDQMAMAFDGYMHALILTAGNPDSQDVVWKPEKLDKVFEECRKYINGSLAPLAYLRMADAKLKLGDRKTAIDYCRKAVDETGTNEQLASDILLRMFLVLGPEEVSKYCRQKIEITPDSLAANWTMFNLSKIKAEYKEAIVFLDRCIDIIGPDTKNGISYRINKAGLLSLAYVNTSDNKYLTQAIAVYESLIDKMPNNTDVLNNLAYMLAQNDERLNEALQYAKKAIDTSPNKAEYLDTYGYTLYKNGKFSQAAEILASALQQYEQDEILAPTAVYEHIGMVKEKLGAKEQALAAYQQALEIGADKLSKKASNRIKSAIERLSR